MTEVTPTLLKQIKKGLRMGDIAKISGATGYSAQTVHEAFKGEAITPSNRVIIEEALRVVKSNAEDAQRVYEAGRKAFTAKKKQGAK